MSVEEITFHFGHYFPVIVNWNDDLRLCVREKFHVPRVFRDVGDYLGAARLGRSESVEDGIPEAKGSNRRYAIN